MTSSALISDINLDHPDDVYEALIKMYEGLSSDESHKASAKLILLLANQVGDSNIVLQACKLARDNSLAQSGQDQDSVK